MASHFVIPRPGLFRGKLDHEIWFWLRLTNVFVLSQLRFKVEEAVALIDQRLQQIFREAFDNDKLSVTDSLSPETVPEWDSLVQVKLIVGCEEEFGVKFSIEETIESNSVGKLKSVLAAKGVAN